MLQCRWTTWRMHNPMNERKFPQSSPVSGRAMLWSRKNIIFLKWSTPTNSAIQPSILYICNNYGMIKQDIVLMKKFRALRSHEGSKKGSFRYLWVYLFQNSGLQRGPCSKIYTHLWNKPIYLRRSSKQANTYIWHTYILQRSNEKLIFSHSSANVWTHVRMYACMLSTKAQMHTFPYPYIP